MSLLLCAFIWPFYESLVTTGGSRMVHVVQIKKADNE